MRLHVSNVIVKLKQVRALCVPQKPRRIGCYMETRYMLICDCIHIFTVQQLHAHALLHSLSTSLRVCVPVQYAVAHTPHPESIIYASVIMPGPDIFIQLRPYHPNH